MRTETLNTIRISLSFMIQFTALLSQEVMNEPLIASYAEQEGSSVDPKDGYLSLSYVYLFNSLSCFISPWIVNELSGKWSIVLGMCFAFIFQIGFFHINRTYLLCSSVIMGFGTTLLWVGHGQYITVNCTDNNMERNTSFQWAFFKLSLILGGLFFLIFFRDSTIQDAVRDNTAQYFFIFFIICTIIAIINTSLLPQMTTEKRNTAGLLQSICEIFKLCGKRRMFFLLFFFFYNGLIRSFWISIYPTSIKFTTKLGLNTSTLIAFSMIVTGIGQISGSIIIVLIGKRIRVIGRDIVICIVLLFHILLFLSIYSFFPNDSPLNKTDGDGLIFQPRGNVAMIIAGLLGFGDAIIQTQVYSLVAEYYKDESGQVFSIFRFFSGLASTLIFLIATKAYLSTHLILLSVFAIIAGVTTVLAHRFSYAHKSYNVRVMPCKTIEPLQMM